MASLPWLADVLADVLAEAFVAATVPAASTAAATTLAPAQTARRRRHLNLVVAVGSALVRMKAPSIGFPQPVPRPWRSGEHAHAYWEIVNVHITKVTPPATES